MNCPCCGKGIWPGCPYQKPHPRGHGGQSSKRVTPLDLSMMLRTWTTSEIRSFTGLPVQVGILKAKPG